MELDWAWPLLFGRELFAALGVCAFPSCGVTFLSVFCYSSLPVCVPAVLFAFLLCFYILTLSTQNFWHLLITMCIAVFIHQAGQFSPDPVYPDVASDPTVPRAQSLHRTTPTSEAICKGRLSPVLLTVWFMCQVPWWPLPLVPLICLLEQLTGLEEIYFHSPVHYKACRSKNIMLAGATHKTWNLLPFTSLL